MQRLIDLSQLDYYSYVDEKMGIGATYQYTKSNIDGTNPVSVHVHLSSFEKIEVLKIYEGGLVGAYVWAEMDWKLFSAERLESHWIYHDATMKPQASLRLEAGQTYTGEVYGRDSPDPQGRFTFNVEHFPWHIYNFDLTSLNISLRHLKEPERTFKASIYDPGWGGDAATVEYKGEIRCDYKADELRHSHRCRLYEVSGEGVGGTTGGLRVDLEKGHIVDIEVPYPNNPDWESFKLRLGSVSHLNPAEWRRFISDTCRKKLRARE